MNTLKTLFTGKSLRALLVMWAVVFVPFVLCFAFQAPTLSGPALPFILRGAAYGLIVCSGVLGLLILPALIRLYPKGATDLRAYLRTTTLWTLCLTFALGGMAGLAALWGGESNWITAVPATVIVSLTALIIPALMAIIGYWFLAARTTPHRGAVPVFCSLFVLWNMECFVIAAGFAAMAIP